MTLMSELAKLNYYAFESYKYDQALNNIIWTKSTVPPSNALIGSILIELA